MKNEGLEAVVRMLIENAADVNVPDEDGMTPLMYASEKGLANIVEL